MYNRPKCIFVAARCHAGKKLAQVFEQNFCNYV